MADWREEFRNGLANLVDQAVVSEARQADVFQAAGEEIERLRVADDRDPDPADDASEIGIVEPANDRPAAQSRRMRARCGLIPEGFLALAVLKTGLGGGAPAVRI